MNPIQEKLLDMFLWFHNYCIDNNITYYAAGGTVLGAARHNGFIPWDDDIDIVIPRKDYNRLIRLFSKKVDHYYLESPYSENKDFLYSYTKLYDTNTTQIERGYIKCKRGVYIDIFPLDGIGTTYNEAIKNFRKVNLVNMFLRARTYAIRKESRWYKNLSILLSRCIPSVLVNNKKLSIYVDYLANSINNDQVDYVANLMGAYREKEIVKKELFGEPVFHDFENISIFIPERYDEYLSKLYGDWKKMPPIEKRKTNHDFVMMDLNKPYMQ